MDKLTTFGTTNADEWHRKGKSLLARLERAETCKTPGCMIVARSIDGICGPCREEER